MKYINANKSWLKRFHAVTQRFTAECFLTRSTENSSTEKVIVTNEEITVCAAVEKPMLLSRFVRYAPVTIIEIKYSIAASATYAPRLILYSFVSKFAIELSSFVF